MVEKQPKVENSELEFQQTTAQALAHFANCLQSHKAALDRLAVNEASEHAKLLEFAEVLNSHTVELGELSRAVEALRSLLQPPLSN